MPNIKKERLDKILSEQFGQITFNYIAEGLRDARKLIRRNIEEKDIEEVEKKDLMNIGTINEFGETTINVTDRSNK